MPGLLSGVEAIRRRTVAQNNNGVSHAVYGFEHPKSLYKSSVSSPGCDTRCTVCTGQWFGPDQAAKLDYERSLTDKEAAKQIEELKTATINNLNYIRTFIEKHGNTIVKAWKSRSSDKRRDIIRQAMPDVVPRPGFLVNELFKRRNSPALPAFLRKYHNSILLSYLDVETLSRKASNLLFLLYHRTRSRPAAWVSFDCLQLESWFTAPMIRTSYNSHCVQMHSNQYGQLISWEKDAAHRLDMIGFPMASLVFQAQHQMSILLRSFVDAIVEQPKLTTIQGRDRLDALILDQLKDIQEQVEDVGSVSWYCNAPAKLSLDVFKDVFCARFNDAADELWLMQTDPAYLRRYLSRFEGATMEGLGPEDARKWKAYTAVIPLAIWDGWRALFIEAEESLDIIEAIEEPIIAGRPLPEEYEVALASFERALLDEFRSQSVHISAIIMCSNTFRQHCLRYQFRDIVLDASATPFEKTDPLLYHLMALATHHGYQRHPAAYHLYMVEHIVVNSKVQSARTNSLLLSVLSSMAAIDEALTVVRSHRPRARPFAEMKDLSCARDHDSRKLVFQLFRTAQRDNFDHLHDVLEKFLRTPSRSRGINREALRIFDESEDAFQQFWDAVRKRFNSGPWAETRDLKNDWITEYVDIHYEAITVSEKEEYRNMVAAERSALVDAIEAQEAKTAAAIVTAAAKAGETDASPQKLWGHQTTETFRPPTEKVKWKTRPLQPATNDLDQGDRGVAETAEAVEKLSVLRIRVEPSSYDIFRQMYETQGDHQGEIKWEDFVAAMIDAKFSVTPRGGSVFTFKSARDGGSINFHRPHPDPSIDPIMLRIMGRRLNKWFRFDKDTFVEGQKQEVESVKEEP
ncbi:hypothetical protein CKM354_000427100 [Cercospora kikuchii]|uniref:Uncharacterized protein n=1 Tax=Cercospora kikuchii TaxID=84275 RepID=A0A9P3FB59_9PEZI|nr:uncharacterized protein CKM354_000427100 [Cercospora kikuchii]GIZ40951.1 hypothetical protein CKM354_000427100 [Cercospora kikuchii]